MNAAVGLTAGLGLDGDRCIRVIPRHIGGGGLLPLVLPGQTHPSGQTPPRQTHPHLGRHPLADTNPPPGQTLPLGRQPPGQTPPGQTALPGRHPPAQCMLGYGQQAGGTHPTGMHSCSTLVVLLLISCRHSR